MHEYVFADKILQTVVQEAKGKPKTVTVEVGELLGLTRESLSTAYEVLSKGTIAEGSKLTVKFAKASVECPKCGFHGRLRVSGHTHAVDPAFACPTCGAPVEVKAGLEANLVAIA